MSNDGGGHVLTAIAGSTLVGTIVGSVLQALWDRRAAKKTPKTEMRTNAYLDFVVHFLTHRVHVAAPLPAADTGSTTSLEEIKARLLVFGEKKVVIAVGTFLGHHNAIDSDAARQEFRNVIRQMRKSVLTGHCGKRLIEGIEGLLAT